MKLTLPIFALLLLFGACKTAPNGTPGTGGEDAILQSQGEVYGVARAERPIDLNPGEWVLDAGLSDNFDKDRIDTKKWNKDPQDWGPWSWEPDNAYVTGDGLRIRMQYSEHTRKGGDLYYNSGIVRALDTITYGYVEARLKGVETFPGASPAFWMYSLGDELDGWGMRERTEGAIWYSEVDMVELTQAEWSKEHGRHGPEVIDCNLHTVVIEDGKNKWKRPGGHPELTKNTYHASFDPREDFHTYGAEVSLKKVVWYIDGIKVAEKPNVYWHLPMHLTLSLGLRWPHVTYKDCPGGAARCPVASEATEEGFPTEMAVDWVRTYRRR